MIDNATQSKLRRLMEARQARDTDKEKSKLSEKAYRAIEAEVWELLDDSPMDPPYNIDLGAPWGKVRFGNRETIYSRIIDEDAAIEYFENTALLDDVSKPKFVAQRLNEIVRDAYEQGQPMPPGVDFVPRRFIAITRQKDDG